MYCRRMSSLGGVYVGGYVLFISGEDVLQDVAEEDGEPIDGLQNDILLSLVDGPIKTCNGNWGCY